MAETGPVVVTGSAGFIGSHLVEELHRQGFAVRCLVRYNSLGNRGWLSTLPQSTLSDIEIIEGDIRDPGMVKELVRGAETVFNLAALIAIPYSYHAPSSYVETNIGGCLNVLEAVKANGNAHIIQMSSSEVYGSAAYVPIDEKHQLNAQSPYAATKTGADQLALSYHQSFGTRVTVARPFNTFGPRQSTRAVIPTIIIQLLNGKQVKLGALETTRDFNFVKDVVQGLIKISKSQAAVGETINIGSGFEISIDGTARLISELMGKEIDLKSEKKRLRPKDSEVVRLLAANQKAKEILQWEPNKTGLEGLKAGLEETIAWFSSSENRTYYTTEYRI